MNRAIDCLVNVDMGDKAQPDWMVRVKEDYFAFGSRFAMMSLETAPSFSVIW